MDSCVGGFDGFRFFEERSVFPLEELEVSFEVAADLDLGVEDFDLEECDDEFEDLGFVREGARGCEVDFRRGLDEGFYLSLRVDFEIEEILDELF